MKMHKEIIAYFLDNGDKEFTGWAIAKALKKDRRVVGRELNILVEKTILSKTKQGSGFLYKFLNANDSLVIEAENWRKERILNDSNLAGLNSYLKNVKSSFFICLLFGSRAIGTHTKNSDYDICIIADGKVQEEVKAALNLLPFKLHILAFTEVEFKAMLKENSFNVGHEIVKKHIVLHGAELFYRMQQK